MKNYVEKSLKLYGVYNHFKGKQYVVVGVSYPDTIMYKELKFQRVNLAHKELVDKKASVFTEDTNNYIISYSRPRISSDLESLSGIYFHDSAKYPGMLVLYMSLYDEPTIWSRPVGMFLSKVDRDKYPQATQDYRLEPITSGYKDIEVRYVTRKKEVVQDED